MLRRATRKIISETFTSRAFAKLAKFKPVRDAFFVASAQFTPFILADSGKLKYLVRTEDVTVARLDPARPPWTGQWFDDLDAAGREAGIAESGTWRAWVDWRGQ